MNLWQVIEKMHSLTWPQGLARNLANAKRLSFCNHVNWVKWPHIFAVQITTRIHIQTIAKIFVIIHSGICLGAVFVALQASVNNVYGDAETGYAVRSLVGAGGSPIPDHDIMNVRDNSVSINHPKPQARFESDEVICCHQIGFVDEIDTQVRACCEVIVVPANTA